MKLTDIAQKEPQAKYHGGEIDPQFVVLHHTAGKYPSDMRTLQGLRGRKVSCHLYVNRMGWAFQLLDTNLKGYHAGVSKWTRHGETFSYLNGHSIGIELENLDGNKHPYTRQQIQNLCLLVVPAIVKAHPILADPDRWVGHEQISPGRKIDPGKLFPWVDLRMAVRQAAKGVAK